MLESLSEEGEAAGRRRTPPRLTCHVWYLHPNWVNRDSVAANTRLCTGSSIFAAVARAVWRAAANVGGDEQESLSAVPQWRHKSCCWSLTPVGVFLHSSSMFSGVFVIVGNLRQLGAETSWETLTGFTGQRCRVCPKFKLLHVYLEKCLKNVDVLPV